MSPATLPSGMFVTQIKTEPNQQRMVATSNDQSKTAKQRQQFVTNQQKFAVFKNDQIYSQWEFIFCFLPHVECLECYLIIKFVLSG